jgi:menaquinone-specific isochorismate synthase
MLTSSGAGRFGEIRDTGTALLESCTVPSDLPRAARPRLFGGFSFHDGTAGGGLWRGFPGAAFLLPAVQFTGVDGEWWLTATVTGHDATRRAEERLDRWRERVESVEPPTRSDPPGIDDRRPTPSQSGWRDQVSAALDSIAAGSLEKVVLAQSLTTRLGGELSLPDALDRLDDTYPDCYRFAFCPSSGGTFFGATPERLVSVRGRTVRTTALAGSTGRGDTPAEDEWLATELVESEKLTHEHDLVVDAVRDQLEPMARTVETGERDVRRLANIQHLRTALSADLADDEHVLSLVEALHPTPAVGGMPPDEALRTIRESEAFDRGWYAAPVGWFDATGDGTFAVAIRSALARDRTATLFAGNGIVADSEPEREYGEVQLKFMPMLDVLE